ncbi:16S rRNA (cytidine(1402)-2'-O)-methyltransferase [bacterium]|nr:16S rRNA (cytidine(1402)-2'-O)-methyltransferase [bacterium]NBX49091.1 16S rRNA (cytidine(1402)-2'-O)-methyltransferase [bacterium]
MCTCMLYIVATPIGNRNDITERAKQTLASVDVVLCEDTRVTAKLCSMLEIQPTLHTFHEHTDDRKRGEIVAQLVAGKNMALVSDAGTPGISDPGGMLVADAVKVGVEVVPIPGVSAVATALSVCGFPTARFTFVGFPPQKKGRETFFRELGDIAHTIVLYESTHRIEKTIEALGVLGRRLCVCRELTKMHETLYRGSASEVLAAFAKTSTKGEFVIVIAPRARESIEVVE